MKKLFVILSTVLMMCAMTACSSDTKTSDANDSQNTETVVDETSESDTISIAVSLMNIDAFMSYVAQGAEDYGIDHPNVKVTVYDAKSDVNSQLTTIENVVNQGIDAIVITPVDTDATAPITALCEQNNIPLVATNAKCSTETTTFVGSDNISSGEQSTQYIMDVLGGEGNVVILVGPLASQNGRDRLTGAYNILEKYPNINVIAEQSADWIRAEAMQTTENWLQSGMEIDAIIAGNDEMAIGAALACNEQNVQVPIVGVGGTLDGLNAVLDGQISATVFWNGFQQGYQGVDAAVRAVQGEILPPTIDVEVKLATKENAADILKLFE
jgi:ABC-type sugar transport system substrate-binding protein